MNILSGPENILLTSWRQGLYAPYPELVVILHVVKEKEKPFKLNEPIKWIGIYYNIILLGFSKENWLLPFYFKIKYPNTKLYRAMGDFISLRAWIPVLQ